MHSIQGVKKQDPICLALPWIVSPLKSSYTRWILRDPCQTRMRKLRWEQGSERWAVTRVILSSPGMIAGEIDTMCSPRGSIKEQFLFFLSLSLSLSLPFFPSFLPYFLPSIFRPFLLSFNWKSVKFVLSFLHLSILPHVSNPARGYDYLRSILSWTGLSWGWEMGWLRNIF